MYTLTNPNTGADISTDWLTLPAGESVTVSESVARDAVKRWRFLSMQEAVEKVAEVEEVVKKVVKKKATKKEVVKKVLKKVTTRKKK